MHQLTSKNLYINYVKVSIINEKVSYPWDFCTSFVHVQFFLNTSCLNVITDWQVSDMYASLFNFMKKKFIQLCVNTTYNILLMTTHEAAMCFHYWTTASSVFLPSSNMSAWSAIISSLHARKPLRIVRYRQFNYPWQNIITIRSTEMHKNFDIRVTWWKCTVSVKRELCKFCLWLQWHSDENKFWTPV